MLVADVVECYKKNNALTLNTEYNIFFFFWYEKMMYDDMKTMCEENC